MGRLGPWGLQAKEHWKEHRPKMYRQLEESGRLEDALYAAQELTVAAMADLIERGVNWYQAWELIREEWLFLPSEEDVPELGSDPMTWQPPLSAEAPASPEAETST